MSAREQRGVSLVELMIALVIGAVVVLGVLTVYAQSRANYRVSETVARLQEKGRYTLAALQPDLELAGYYGFAASADVFRFVRDGDASHVIADAAALRQSASEALASLPKSAHACGVNFAVDLHTPVQSFDGAFALGRDRTRDCDPYRARARAGADTLTLRRVTTRDTKPESGRLQIYTARSTSQTAQFLFADGVAPGAIDANARVRDLVVRSYYIARDSVERANFPALRVKSLTRVRGVVAFDEDEVMPGIEDLQVQLGVRHRVTGARRHVNPDYPDLASNEVLSIRIWLRVRADEPDAAFMDVKTYRYANVTFTPVGAERSFRRVLMSRTVVLRNARTL